MLQCVLAWQADFWQVLEKITDWYPWIMVVLVAGASVRTVYCNWRARIYAEGYADGLLENFQKRALKELDIQLELNRQRRKDDDD